MNKYFIFKKIATIRSTCKYFLSPLLLMPYSATSQTPFWGQDQWFHKSKFEHFVVSMTFTPAPIRVLEDFKVKNPEIKGALIMFSAGVAKEYLYDNNPSVKDMTFNLAGCVAGYYLNRLYNNIEKDRKRKRMARYMPFYEKKPNKVPR